MDGAGLRPVPIFGVADAIVRGGMPETGKMETYRSYSGERVSNPEGSRTLIGRPIVFGQRSVLLGDWEHGSVYEVVERGAVTDELLLGDIVANINHDDNQILGRSYGGKGSLELTLDDKGVGMRLDAPLTVYGDVAVCGAARGDLRGMSFAFWLDPEKDVRYGKEKDVDGKTVYVRHIERIRRLTDVSIVTHPAYPATSVEARGIEAELRAAFPGAGDSRAAGAYAPGGDAAAGDIESIRDFLKKRQ